MHTGGIFAALSPSTADVLLEALHAAKAAGTVVSYDLNFRAGLWANQGGRDRAVEVNRALAPYVDVMLGNEEDFSAALGFEVGGLDEDLSELDPTNFKAMIGEVIDTYPNLQVVATTLRRATTANRNDWGAIAYADGAFHHGHDAPRPGDLRSRRRGRRLRLRVDLRAAGGQSRWRRVSSTVPPTARWR